MHCYLPVFLGLFELFIRDFTRSKCSLHFKYHLVCHFVDATIQLPLKFSLSSLTVNSYQASFHHPHLLLTLIGGEVIRFHKILKSSTRLMTMYAYAIFIIPQKYFKKFKNSNIKIL